MRKKLFLIAFVLTTNAVMGQDKNDILNVTYVEGKQIYRNDFDNTYSITQHKTINAELHNGSAFIFENDWIPVHYKLPTGTTGYLVDVEAKMNEKWTEEREDQVNKSNGYTIVFQGHSADGISIKGVYLTECRTSTLVPTSQKLKSTGYMSIGRQDGEDFKELKNIPDSVDDEYHLYQMAVVDDQYYFYKDHRFLCVLPANDANPVRDSVQAVFLVNNHKEDPRDKSEADIYHFPVNYVNIRALVQHQIVKNDIPTTAITLLTPVDNDEGIPEDSEGKITVSGKVIDTISGIAWVRLNGENIGHVQPDGYFSYNAAHLSNVITLQAGNKAGKVTTKAFELHNIIRKDEVHIPLIPPNHPPVFYALLIACRDYKAPWERLPTTISETEALYKVLTTYYGFAEEHVKIIRNGMYDDVIKSLEKILRQMREGDNLVISFSGHGSYNEDINRPVGYWIPIDGVDQNHKFITSDQIKSFISASNCAAEHILILSDACYGAAFRDDGLLHMNHNERVSYGYKSVTALTAGGFEKVPGKSKFMSEITRILLENATTLEQPYLMDNSLYVNLAKPVQSETKTDPRIFPFGDYNNNGGNFFFMLKRPPISK